MADVRIPARRRPLIPAVALFIVCTLVGASFIGSIFHIHKSAEAAATCPICQISHCVAVRTTPAALLSFPHLLSGEVVVSIHDFVHLNCFLTLHLTRAPPSV